MTVLESVHCSQNCKEEEKEKFVKDGMWVTMTNKCTKDELKNYISNSKKVKSAIGVSKMIENTAGDDEANRWKRSLTLLYKGAMITQKKYQIMRNSEKECREKDQLIPYKSLILKIARRHNMEMSVSPLTDIKGFSRSLKETLGRLANMYLLIIPDELVFFSPGVFVVITGGDGAPMPTLEGEQSGTAFVISFLNVVERLSSPKHNFLLFGGHCGEDDDHFISRLKQFSREMEELQVQEMVIMDQSVKFECQLVVGDQKWLALAGGELPNSATYPSSFANIHKAEVGRIDGSLGHERCVWHPWKWEKRLADIAHLNQLGVTTRSKMLKVIAQRRSRQEVEPPIGQYIQFARIDPLHISNLAWEKLYRLIYVIVIRTFASTQKLKLSSTIKANEITGSLKEHLGLLEKFRLLRVKNAVKKHVTQNGMDKDLCLRLTGAESKILCEHVVHLLDPLRGHDDDDDFHLTVLAFIGQELAQITSLVMRMKITEDQLDSLKEHCTAYHICYSLFLVPNLTTWTIGYVVPFHAYDLYERYGYGLGLATLQGREAKHQQVKKYLAHTPATSACGKWQLVSRSEYAEQVLLPEALGTDGYNRVVAEIERCKVKMPSGELLQQEVLMAHIKLSVDQKKTHQTLEKYIHKKDIRK